MDKVPNPLYKTGPRPTRSMRNVILLNTVDKQFASTCRCLIIKIFKKSKDPNHCTCTVSPGI